MIAVRISADWRLVAVASPNHLRRHAPPKTPHDLVHHNCINHRQARSGGVYSWEFGKDGHELRVRVEGQVTLNTSCPMVEVALAGCGIAYIGEDLVQQAYSRWTFDSRHR